MIINADSLCALPLADASVQMCVTSPPYWGLRDYGIEGQLGLEATPAEFVAHMVSVFQEVRRVLRDDGTLWVNIGDSYSNGGRGAPGHSTLRGFSESCGEARAIGYRPAPEGYKPKDLVGIPWMLAFALRADGWYLRSDIIWSKPNPMPESVTDRPTKSHEYLFLMSKQARYYYDAEAVKEPADEQYAGRYRYPLNAGPKETNGAGRPGNAANTAGMKEYTGSRNRRSVWSIPTYSYDGAHFATFPPALVEPCILAGSRGPGRRCDCDEVINTPTGEGATDDPTLYTGRAGMNRERRPGEGRRPITRREQRAYAEQLKNSPHRRKMEQTAGTAFQHYIRTDDSGARPLPPELLCDWLGRGWLTDPAPCNHPDEPGDIVLDPFAGSGTTGQVARLHGRRFVGIDLNMRYLSELALPRAENRQTAQSMATLPLFAAQEPAA